MSTVLPTKKSAQLAKAYLRHLAIKRRSGLYRVVEEIQIRQAALKEQTVIDLIFGEVIFRAICFPIGWPLMKTLTLGKYPVKGSWLSGNPSAEWTSAIGLATLVIAMMVVMKQFVFG